MASNSLATVTTPEVILWEEPEFTFGTTLVNNRTFVHIAVHEWGLSVLKRLKHVWQAERHRLPPIVFAQGHNTDAVWVKFVRQLGFVPIIDCPCSDGNNRLIYAHFGN